MRHVSYTYTVGMDDEEVRERLADSEYGVLSLADGDDAYGVPLSFAYRDGEILLHLGDREDSEKIRYVETTEAASFLVYEGGDDSWSVVARGPLAERDGLDDATINELFGSMRIFGEDVADLDHAIYALVPETLTGRTVA